MKKNVKMGVYTHNGEEINFNFYTSLRANDKLTFVNSVIDIIVDKKYNSIIRDLIFDYMIIEVFTDIDTTNIKKANNSIDMIEDLLEETNIVEIVRANVKTGLIEELDKAVNDNIVYLTGINKNPIVEVLGNLLNTIENKLANIDTEAIAKAAQMITTMTGELTATNILEEYAKSDIFKEKYRQIIAEKEQHNVEIENTDVAIKKVKQSGSK